MKSYVKDLELETEPKQSFKQLDEDPTRKRDIKPLVNDVCKRPLVKKQEHTQIKNMRTKGIKLENETGKLQNELEAERKKNIKIMLKYELGMIELIFATNCAKKPLKFYHFSVKYYIFDKHFFKLVSVMCTPKYV